MYKCLALLLGAAVMLAGCWDIKTIQNLNYVTAIGFDYQDGKYVVYTQLLDFSNVAKQEGGASGKQQASIWVGKGKGDSVPEAIGQLYDSSQQPMFWGHVSSFVFTKAALKQGGETEWIDAFIRFRETRYTQWVFGTTESIEEVLITKPFFNMSPMSSILHEPVENYRRVSLFEPVQLFRFIAELREPGRVALLPSLGIERDVWTKDGKSDPKLYINGVFAVEREQDATWLDRRHLSGLRWLEPYTSHTPLGLSLQRQRESVQLTAQRPKSSVTLRFENNVPVADIDIRLTATIGELKEQPNMAVIRQTGEKTIEDEIRRTFEYAGDLGVDVYSLEHTLYHDYFRHWRDLTDNGRRAMPPIRLGRIDVSLSIESSGMYTVKTKE